MTNPVKAKSYTLWYRNNVVPDCQNKTYKVCNARKTVLGNSGGYDKNRFEILPLGVKPKVKLKESTLCN